MSLSLWTCAGPGILGVTLWAADPKNVFLMEGGKYVSAAQETRARGSAWGGRLWGSEGAKEGTGRSWASLAIAPSGDGQPCGS